MTNLRKDSAVIKAISKRYGPMEALRHQQRPFFYIDNEAEKQFTSPVVLNNEGYPRQLPKYSVNCTAENNEEIDLLLPYHDFNVFIEGVGYFMITKGSDDTSWRMANVLDKLAVNLLELTHLKTPSELEGVVLIQDFLMGSENKFSKPYHHDFDYLPTNNIKLDGAIIKHLTEMATDKSFRQKQFIFAIRTIEYVLSYFKWAETQNLFLVRQQPISTKQDIKTAPKKPWVRKDTPHYIYLNQLPSHHHKTSNKGGDGSSKRGHNRRAHWRYLKADCYKEAKGKRIRIKESWIGPTETTYHGSTYTVLLEGANYE